MGSGDEERCIQGSSSMIAGCLYELKLVDAYKVVKEVRYAKQNKINYGDKLGKKLARILWNRHRVVPLKDPV